MKELEKLLSFVAGFRDFHDEKAFFRSIDRFVQENWQGEPVLFFSLPHTLDSKISIDQCRLIWNKKRIEQNEIEQETFNKVVFESVSPYQNQEKEFYVFQLGVDGTQELKMFVEVPKDSSLNRLQEHFTKFLQSGYENLEKIKEIRRLQSLVHIDDVTGLYNQRKLLKDLDEAIERFEKDKEPFYVLFIDIDHFKKVNDGHGHLIGTKILVDMAKLMRRTLRETDLVYRYGGDEYVLILPGANDQIARMVGRRMLKAIKENHFYLDKSGKQEVQLSVSIGLAGFPNDAKSRDDILNIADRMMYQAKESGRGKVCHAGELFDS